MIRTISIENFRCFENLYIPECRRVNVIVGDNGAGKTALLEAVFLALGSSPELALRFKAARGMDLSFLGGTPADIDEALWQDMFFRQDWNRDISIALEGTGEENRSVRIRRGIPEETIPLGQAIGMVNRGGPVEFTWRNSRGDEVIRRPEVSEQKLKWSGQDESLPDFFFFPANQIIGMSETAGKFSQLSKAQSAKKFVNAVSSVYPWIEDIRIEVFAGRPVLCAVMNKGTNILPLPLVSGSINRVIAILIAIASRPTSVTLVDEIENGIYHSHKSSILKLLLDFSSQFEGQLFLTTHDEEWLEALFDNPEVKTDDVMLWRVKKSADEPAVDQFSGRQVALGIKLGEIR